MGNGVFYLGKWIHSTEPFTFCNEKRKLYNLKFGWENCHFLDFPFGVCVNTNGNSTIFRVLSFTDGLAAYSTQAHTS